jgi:hypothetical protein
LVGIGFALTSLFLFVGLLLLMLILPIPFFGLYQEGLRIIVSTQNFSSYTKAMKDKIQKLGGNPEDLDKEETQE